MPRFLIAVRLYTLRLAARKIGAVAAEVDLALRRAGQRLAGAADHRATAVATALAAQLLDRHAPRRVGLLVLGRQPGEEAVDVAVEEFAVEAVDAADRGRVFQGVHVHGASFGACGLSRKYLMPRPRDPPIPARRFPWPSPSVRRWAGSIPSAALPPHPSAEDAGLPCSHSSLRRASAFGHIWEKSASMSSLVSTSTWTVVTPFASEKV